jgi:uncharacterized protein YdeI (YjbR/CyaY-like superfamily)
MRFRATIEASGKTAAGIEVPAKIVERRAAAGVATGDTVIVDIALDTEPREVAVPADLLKVLKKEADARRAFEALPYSHKQRHVLAIEDAKTSETRQRRIEETVAMLRAGR